MKKIAMVITGHLRSFKDNFENLKKFFLDRYDVDIYASTWNKNFIGVGKNNFTLHTKEEIYNLLSIYPNLKGINISDYDEINSLTKNFLENFGSFKRLSNPYYRQYQGALLTKELMTYNIGQWYLVEKGFEIIENKEKYDIFFRNRFDINFLRDVHLLENDLVMIAPPKINLVGKHIWKLNCNVRNQLFYGNRKVLDIINNLYTKYRLAQCIAININTDNLLEYVFDPTTNIITKDYELTEYYGFEIKK